MMLYETRKAEKTPLLRVAKSAFESYSIRIRLELIFMDAHYTSHFRYLAYKLTDASSIDPFLRNFRVQHLAGRFDLTIPDQTVRQFSRSAADPDCQMHLGLLTAKRMSRPISD